MKVYEVHIEGLNPNVYARYEDALVDVEESLKIDDPGTKIQVSIMEMTKLEFSGVPERDNHKT